MAKGCVVSDDEGTESCRSERRPPRELSVMVIPYGAHSAETVNIDEIRSFIRWRVIPRIPVEIADAATTIGNQIRKRKGAVPALYRLEELGALTYLGTTATAS